MAPLTSSTRELFSEAVRAVLETWPVLQIAVDNGFGGAYSQQKAEWMVDALQQYFVDNDELQQDEVEDFISDLMNNEFDTVVDDGSLPQVYRVVDVCLPSSLCLHSVRERADDVSCLREPGAQRYANTYVDRQVGKPIKMLGPSILIGRTFLDPTPSTEYINAYKYI
uniref:Pre-rRNA-processing protein TSR2 homolog n=1 Tax=Sinocyclocheilus rhinocerous TaxID=307959 RepID=A0A673GQY1_9TELE